MRLSDACRESLIGGWFHQDFDINGETLDQIISLPTGPSHRSRSSGRSRSRLKNS
jgi:hypothetical protein